MLNEIEKSLKESIKESIKLINEIKILQLYEKNQLSINNLKFKFEQLQFTNKEFSEFTGIMAHDLKAPLRDIYNLSNFIEDDIKKEKDVSKFIELLRFKIKKMEELILGLIECFKIDKIVLNNEFVNTKEIINDIKKELLIVENKINIECQQNMPIIKTNKIKIRQVFYNLIQNSIKYHNDPNNILISINYWPKNLKSNCNDYWTFCVSDNGSGIDPKYHEKIFEIFKVLFKK
jgi:light-regulated signal transduction histidine kinase (bacteriophytochrome)